MYHPILFLHWKQIRWVLAVLALTSFALPLVSIQGTADVVSPYALLSGTAIWLPLFPALAVAIGSILGLSAWNWDHVGNHVYALSLPISRARYAGLKMGAGALLLLLPAGTFWVGSLLAASALELPAGLHAYPNQLAIRFLVASLTAYAAIFAMAAGTVRTVLIALGVFVGLLLFGNSIDLLLSNAIPYFRDHEVMGEFLGWMGSGTGPLRVFTGSWMLIDV
ncbi:MAG: hypothetical protein ACE5GJ_02185 [Gemmatimonadota bacterium]